MRIALITDTFFPQINGVASVVKQLATSLQKRGHEVWVFSPAPAHGHTKLSGQSYEIIHLPSCRFPGYLGERIALPSRRLTSTLQAIRPDIIHLHTPFSLGWQAVGASKRLGIPLIGTHHTFFDLYLKYARMEYGWAQRFVWNYTVWFYNHCDLVLSPSHALANGMKRYGLKSQVEIAHNPVDTDLFAPANDSNARDELKTKLGLRATTLVYMGRISYEKYIDQVLRAFALVASQSKDVSLLIIGDGPTRKNLEKLSQDLHINDQVLFVGFQTNKKLVEMLQLGDIFVTASTTENMPISILEAMAVGLPVIGPNALGIPELIGDNETGLLFTPHDTADMARKIITLMSAKNIRDFAHNSHQKALTYSQDAVISSLEHTYKRIAMTKSGIVHPA